LRLPTAPDLLTPNEASLILRVSTVTLKRWRTSGEGPSHLRMGKNVVRYERISVERWLASGRAAKVGRGRQ
jgi:predicted DNA-binding transcriptional regulator AlpA